MRAYRIDDLTPQDVALLKERLNALHLAGSVEGMYWLPVAAEHLSPLQREHLPLCGPYALALEVEEDCLHLELLVRARNQLRCACVHYASPELRAHMLQYMDDMLRELHIPA